MAGAGGVLLAHFDGYLNPKSFEFIKSFEILIMIILGGLGSIVGSVLGAILLTILPEALRGFAQYRMVIYSLLLWRVMRIGWRSRDLFGLAFATTTVGDKVAVWSAVVNTHGHSDHAFGNANNVPVVVYDLDGDGKPEIVFYNGYRAGEHIAWRLTDMAAA